MASFGQQLNALLRRNVMLKRRNKSQLFQEILWPVFLLLIVTAYKAANEPKKAIQSFTVYNVKDSEFGSSFLYKSILVVPDTHQVDVWMQNVVAQLPGRPNYKLFPTTDLAEAEYLSKHTIVAAGVIFNFTGDSYSYAIRMDYDSVPSTSGSKFDVWQSNRKCGHHGDTVSPLCIVNKYLTTGFAQLQVAVENVLMRNLNITSNPMSREIKVQMMDRREFLYESITTRFFYPIFLTICYFDLCNFLAVNIVAEKEKKIKEGMLMMGLRSSVFWLSWGLVYFVLVTVLSSVGMVFMGLFSFYRHSNMYLVFLCFLVYGWSIVAFSFMITPFFNKAEEAGTCAVCILLLGPIISGSIIYSRDYMMYDSTLSTTVQWILCLFSPISFSAFIDQGIFLDTHMNGFDYNKNLTYGKFPLYAPILMLVVDLVLYSLLTVYFDSVIPGEFGVKRHPLYFLHASYWCPRKQDLETSRLVDQNQDQSQTIDVELVGRDMESKIAMRISSLTKTFITDHKIQNAVNGFSLDIYEGQITCLLGHNGAGKTTLINMLTGFIPPTSGNATIMGLDITQASDMAEIRKMCGICPQHNILYDELNCREHLELFASIKGIHPYMIYRTVAQALSDVDLVSQTETFAKDLSGGQKRKLSVAIALIGYPKLIILDEPTAGMDPFSRHHLWSLLKRMKEGKVVLLTTHFMDEADILADRKAFIRKGKLRCCGSSLFLKNKFGIGYHLTMIVAPNFNVAKVTSLLKNVIPDVVHQRSHGKEISYTVPLKDVSKFSDLFLMLDEVAEVNGIKSYGVSMTTLEEVFLKLETDKIGDDDDANAAEVEGHLDVDKDDGNIDIHAPAPVVDSFGKSTVVGSHLTNQRIRSLLKIRYLLIVQNRSLFCLIFMSVAAVFGTLLMVKIIDTTPAQISSPLTFNPSFYVMSANVESSTPALLVLDAVNNNDSKAVISDWRRHYAVDTFAAGTNISTVSPHYLGVQINTLKGHDLANLVVLYNDSAIHSIPVIITMATQSILRSSNISVNISGNSFPWPLMILQFSQYFTSSSLAIGCAFLMIIILFSADVVKDREVKLRNQLRISGVSFNIYWATIYLCDLLIYMIPTVLIIIAVLAIQDLGSGGALGAVIIMLIINVLLNILLAFVLSFMFDKYEECIGTLFCCLFCVTYIPFIFMAGFDRVHSRVGIYIHYIACIIDPFYTIFGGCYFIKKVSLTADLTNKDNNLSEYFKFDNHVLITIVMPIIHILWMYWLLRVLDVWATGGDTSEAFPEFLKSQNSVEISNPDIIQNEDEDVLAERVRIERLNTAGDQEYVAYTSQVRKVYTKLTSMNGNTVNMVKVAVRNLSIGVQPGEVLGLLGPNGAGKSTALSMMIAEISPSCGKVVVAGHTIHPNMLSVLDVFGYCPQQDALWETITLEEHIKCFASIRGVAADQIDSVVNFFMDQLELQEHRKKQGKKLSGGTKRKLSYIMGILGSPQFVLMDEPSTGLDPQSKRFLWDTISSSFNNTNRGAILTTHYMEEADALCGRVGIMVNGELKCLGAPEYLKNKHGSGYMLDVKLAIFEQTAVDPLMDRLENHLRKLIPGLNKVERFQERAQYSIPKECVVSLGYIFASLEKCILALCSAAERGKHGLFLTRTGSWWEGCVTVSQYWGVQGYLNINQSSQAKLQNNSVEAFKAMKDYNKCIVIENHGP